MSELPPIVQNLVAQLQQLQQQIQAVISQRVSMESLLRETEQAIEELEKNQSEFVFKSIGSILAKDTRENVLKELKDKKETYEVRIKTLQRQEEKLRERFAETQKKLQSYLSQQSSEPRAL
ncbi:MAG: prefoldin subunit beta [Archaeoglobaceae archaeon]|nr:prefoldin subunit beta [Archaeoglobaceae archaeon]MCX8152525.1 prefoldin subunit beta [Archaeoglobaceae archaeon]MDW8014054.1 prefoldin subunit beta [Archaeoglobaceae archaeon]